MAEAGIPDRGLSPCRVPNLWFSDGLLRLPSPAGWNEPDPCSVIDGHYPTPVGVAHGPPGVRGAAKAGLTASRYNSSGATVMRRSEGDRGDRLNGEGIAVKIPFPGRVIRCFRASVVNHDETQIDANFLPDPGMQPVRDRPHPRARPRPGSRR